MSSFFGGLWGSTFGLLVEDGSLAIGIVVALAIAGIIAGIGGQPEIGGWWLLGSLVVLLVANVYRVGVGVKRAVGSEPTGR